jgi:transposase-like protein
MPGTRRRFTSEFKAKAAEQARLRREAKRLEQEKEILKRAVASLHPECVPTLRYRFVAAERAHFSVQMLCRTVGVAVSGFYAWLPREPS